MDHTIPPSPAPSSLCDPSLTNIAHFKHEPLEPQPALAYPTPDLSSVASQFDSTMAYVPSTQDLSFSYSDLPPEEDTDAFNTGHVASTPQTYNLHTPEASPPTPKQHLDSSSYSAPRTRGSQGPKTLGVKTGRITKATPPKRPLPLSASPPSTKKGKQPAESADSSVISVPLSILAKDWDLPFVDIEAYVNRSIEERRAEIARGKTPGKVKRAMNAFMLYRKAFQDRAKKFAQQQNHQVVSKVCGRSWSIEPESVRSQFNEWAIIERDNHRKAHPEYKFTPSKPRKRGKDGLDSDSEADDPNWDRSSRQASKRRSSSRTPLRATDGAYYSGPTYHTPYHSATTSTASTDLQHAAFHPYHSTRPPPNMPSFPRHSSGPYDLDSAFAAGTMSSHRPHGDMHQQQMDVMGFLHPAHHHSAPHQHPTHQSFAMSGPYPVVENPLGGPSGHVMGMGQPIDPTLAGHDGMPRYDMTDPVLGGGLDDPEWPAGYSLGGPGADLYPGPFVELRESYMQDAQLQYLQGEEEGWRINPPPP